MPAEVKIQREEKVNQNNVEINDIRHNVILRDGVPNLPVYESLTDILDIDECNEYENDLEEGKYEHWLELYPDKATAIFSDLVNLSFDELFDIGVIGYFQDRGVDINANGGFRSDAGSTTPLVHACEFRRRLLMESLILCGADVNKKDIHGFSPLDSYIAGHDMYYKPSVDNQDQMQADIELMQRYGLILEVQARIVEENFEDNEDFSFIVRNDFFKNFCDRIEKVGNNADFEDPELGDEFDEIY